MNRRVRTRYAPSPTGPQHIGGLRTALYAYLLAKKHGGDFLLRIEDTDQTRYVEGAEEYIVEALNWAGITVDEGFGIGGKHAPYRQSERKPMYRQYADQLLANGYAYYAFDTAEELDEMRKRMEMAKVSSPQYNAITRESMRNSLTLPAEEVASLLNASTPYVIRMKIPRGEEIRFKDLIRGWVIFNSNEIDDKVLLKSDGMPTYHFANVVDDYLMEISHVVRGEEWLPSAPAHVLLYKFLGWETSIPEFAHLPLILKPEGTGKLSKRDGAKFGFPSFPLQWLDKKEDATTEIFTGYREEGFYPEAIINFLALLGWSEGNNRELYTMEELIQVFSLERVNKSGARFNYDKAKWFNQQYLKQKDATTLVPIFDTVLKEKNIHLPNEKIAHIIALVKDRCVIENDLWKESSYFFTQPTSYDPAVVEKKWNEKAPTIVSDLTAIFKQIQEFIATNLDAAFKAYLAENNLKTPEAMPLVRLLITGIGAGPSIFEIMAIIGKEESIQRLKTGLNQLALSSNPS